MVWKNFTVYIEISDVPNSEGEEKTEAAYLGKEEWSASQGKKKAERRSWWPHSMNFQFKHVYLYLWTNGCSWPCVLRECTNNSSTTEPLIRNHGFHCHQVVAVSKCTNQCVGAWKCLHEAHSIINLRSKT